MGKRCRDDKLPDGNAIGKNIVTVDPINHKIICCLQDDTKSEANWKELHGHFQINRHGIKLCSIAKFIYGW